MISSKVANGYLSNFVRECVGDANCKFFGDPDIHEGVSGQSWGGISRRSGFVLRSLLLGLFPGFGPPGGKWRKSDSHVAVYQRALPTPRWK